LERFQGDAGAEDVAGVEPAGEGATEVAGVGDVEEGEEGGIVEGILGLGEGAEGEVGIDEGEDEGGEHEGEAEGFSADKEGEETGLRREGC
jgi:hypothetical protein